MQDRVGDGKRGLRSTQNLAQTSKKKLQMTQSPWLAHLVAQLDADIAESSKANALSPVTARL